MSLPPALLERLERRCACGAVICNLASARSPSSLIGLAPKSNLLRSSPHPRALTRYTTISPSPSTLTPVGGQPGDVRARAGGFEAQPLGLPSDPPDKHQQSSKLLQQQHTGRQARQGSLRPRQQQQQQQQEPPQSPQDGSAGATEGGSQPPQQPAAVLTGARLAGGPGRFREGRGPPGPGPAGRGGGRGEGPRGGLQRNGDLAQRTLDASRPSGPRVSLGNPPGLVPGPLGLDPPVEPEPVTTGLEDFLNTLSVDALASLDPDALASLDPAAPASTTTLPDPPPTSLPLPQQQSVPPVPPVPQQQQLQLQPAPGSLMPYKPRRPVRSRRLLPPSSFQTNGAGAAGEDDDDRARTRIRMPYGDLYDDTDPVLEGILDLLRGPDMRGEVEALLQAGAAVDISEGSNSAGAAAGRGRALRQSDRDGGGGGSSGTTGTRGGRRVSEGGGGVVPAVTSGGAAPSAERPLPGRPLVVAGVGAGVEAGVEAAAATSVPRVPARSPSRTQPAVYEQEHKNLRRRGGFFAHKAQLLAPLYDRRRASYPVTSARLLGMSAAYTPPQAAETSRRLGLPRGGRVGHFGSGGLVGDRGGGSGSPASDVMPYRYGIGARGQVVDMLRQARQAATSAIPERVRRRLLAVAKQQRAVRPRQEEEEDAGESLWEENEKWEGRDVAADAAWPLEEDEETRADEAEVLASFEALFHDEATEEEADGQQQQQQGLELEGTAAGAEAAQDNFGAGAGGRTRTRASVSDAAAEAELRRADLEARSALRQLAGERGVARAMEAMRQAASEGRGWIGEEGKGEDEAPAAAEDPLEAMLRAIDEDRLEDGRQAGGAEEEEEEEEQLLGTDDDEYGDLEYDEAEYEGSIDSLIEALLDDGSAAAADTAAPAAEGSPDRASAGAASFRSRRSEAATPPPSPVPPAATGTTAAEGRKTSASSPAAAARDPQEEAALATAAQAPGAGRAAGSPPAPLPLPLAGYPELPVDSRVAATAAAVEGAASGMHGQRGTAGLRAPRESAGNLGVHISEQSQSQSQQSEPDQRPQPSSGPLRSPRKSGGYLTPTAPAGWQQYGSSGRPAVRQPPTVERDKPATVASASVSARRPSLVSPPAAAAAAAAASSAAASSAAAPPQPPWVLRAFLYCVTRDQLHDALWRTDLLERLQFVSRMRDADVVLHRSPAPGEKQFALEQMSRGARRARIPFISLPEVTEAQLVPRLEREIRRFADMFDKVVGSEQKSLQQQQQQQSQRPQQPSRAGGERGPR